MTLSLGPLAKELCRSLNATLSRELGSGAYKQAFLIERNGESFALKIAPISGGIRTRSERETEALKSCSHPAIAKLEEAYLCTHVGVEYWVIVEEFLPDGTLSDRLLNGALSVDQTRHIGLTLAGALGHLHDRDFVHRDIKPDNILFKNSKDPVITDFGIVRFLGAPSLTSDFLAQGPGTPLFASPEQLLNDKALINWRTDQFCLALVLATCVLGVHPFTPPATGSQYDAIVAVSTRAPMPTKWADELTKIGFGNLVKALSPWPIDRYRTPEQFIAALT